MEWTDLSLGRAQKITDGRYYIVAYKDLPDGEERTVTVKVPNVTFDDLSSYAFHDLLLIYQNVEVVGLPNTQIKKRS